MMNGNVRDQRATAEANCELDEVLYNQESGVEIALHRAQQWSKFVKDLINFIDKRTNICEFIFTVTVCYVILSILQHINKR